MCVHHVCGGRRYHRQPVTVPAALVLTGRAVHGLALLTIAAAVIAWRWFSGAQWTSGRHRYVARHVRATGQTAATFAAGLLIWRPLEVAVTITVLATATATAAVVSRHRARARLSRVPIRVVAFVPDPPRSATHGSPWATANWIRPPAKEHVR